MSDPQLIFTAEQCVPGSGPGYEHQIADQMNRCWEVFEPYADTSFVKNSQEAMADLCKHSLPGPSRSSAYDALHRQWWEMFVGCILLDAGIALVPRSEWKRQWGTAGPDFQARVGEKTVWIECIAPEAGNTPDAVPEPVIPTWNCDEPDGERVPVTEYLPSREIMLRLTGAIHNKRCQYQAHRKLGIIGENDPYVIALNGRCISPLIGIGEDAPTPLIAKVLFGLGELSVSYNRATNVWAEPQLTRKTALRRASGATVGTNIFCDGSAIEVTGVLYSSIDSANVGNDPHAQMLFVANHTSANPLPMSWIPRARTCGVTTNDDGTAVFWHDSQ